jgi:hypothetical protein
VAERWEPERQASGGSTALWWEPLGLGSVNAVGRGGDRFGRSAGSVHGGNQCWSLWALGFWALGLGFWVRVLCFGFRL